MRHRHGWRKLNITDGAHRRAMMRHICNALIEHEQITTTLPRAKELRRIIEPLVTLGKVPSVHRRRIAFARLQSRAAVSKLFNDLGARFSSRPGGYVRILKNGFRKGDNAPMALVEFVEKAASTPEIETDEKGGNTAKGGRKTSAAKTTKTASTKTASAKSAKTASAESAKSAKTASTKTANAETAKTASTKTENTESAKTAKSASAESAKTASTKTASAESAKTAKTAKAETESKAAESGDSAATKTEKS